MMTDTPNSGERKVGPASAASAQAICSQKQEQRGLPIAMARMMGLDTAAKLLGKGNLAEDLGITVRALNYKIDAGRGISDVDVRAAALALEERAERLLVHARKLRDVLPPRPANLLESTKPGASL